MSDQPSSPGFESSLRHMPPHLQGPFAALRGHEAAITKLLSTEEGQKLFMADPVRALETAGVRLDPALRKAMLAGMRGGADRHAASLLHANGSLTRPKARIRFV